MTQSTLTRRDFCHSTLSVAVAAALGCRSQPFTKEFRLRYMVASCMYGGLSLETIVPEVRKSGATHIDVWSSHGKPKTQHEMMTALGYERFVELLDDHQIKLGCLTHYSLGPFGLQEEMKVAEKFGGTVLVSGSDGSSGLEGEDLKKAVYGFAEKMKPHVEIAEETGCTIAIENHGGALIKSPDSIRWLVEAVDSKHLGIALAPYHLPQDEEMLAGLIADLDHRLAVFYAWQYGMGCSKKLPKEQEILQMPGRGDLDFAPLVAALKKIDYRGWTVIFMHPVPRGIPIMDTAAEVTAEINRSRGYLDACLASA